MTSDTAAKALPRFAPLRDAGFVLIERFDLADVSDPGRLVEAFSAAWGVIVSSANRLGRDVIESLPALRVIGRTGVGYDAIDVRAATEHGVLVFTTPGTLTDAVADFTLAHMLASLRHLSTLNVSVRTGPWRPIETGHDLHGATVVIIGFGAIGKAVAKRLHGFSCRIIAVDPLVDEHVCAQLGVEKAELAEALPLADAVTVHVPLTPSTRALLGRRELSWLRPSAIVVNTSRGAVIDESALVDALRDRRIAGAALDVFDVEPLPAGHPLVTLETVALSPHAASSTFGAIAAMCDAVVAGLLSFESGRMPDGCLNPEAVPAPTRRRD